MPTRKVQTRLQTTDAEHDEQNGYSSWQQVSGYFDGDGNVGIEFAKRILRIKIRFVDTRRPQVDSIRGFLRRRKVNTGHVGREDKKGVWQAAHRFDVTEVESVLKAAKAMLPYVVKKRGDLQIAIDYIEGRITGNEALSLFNNEVRRESSLCSPRRDKIVATRKRSQGQGSPRRQRQPRRPTADQGGSRKRKARSHQAKQEVRLFPVCD